MFHLPQPPYPVENQCSLRREFFDEGRTQPKSKDAGGGLAQTVGLYPIVEPRAGAATASAAAPTARLVACRPSQSILKKSGTLGQAAHGAGISTSATPSCCFD